VRLTVRAPLGQPGQLVWARLAVVVAPPYPAPIGPRLFRPTADRKVVDVSRNVVQLINVDFLF
jgi:hypothetical protein